MILMPPSGEPKRPRRLNADTVVLWVLFALIAAGWIGLLLLLEFPPHFFGTD